MPTHPASVMSRIVPLLFALLLSAAATAQSSDADRLRGYAEADGVTFVFDAARYGLDIATDALRAEAIEWSVTRGTRSGRVAWQFIQDLAGRLGKRLE